MDARAHRSYAKSARRVQKILDVAIGMLAQSGYRGFSMRELADAVGLTQSGLLHHFATKQALALAVLDERKRRSGAGDHDPRDVEPLRNTIRNAAAEPELSRLYLAMLGEASHASHPLHDYFAADFAWKRAAFTAGFEESRRLGDIRTDLPAELLAEWFIALTDGLQTQWLYDDDMDLIAAFDRLLLHVAPSIGASERVMAKLRAYNGLE